MLTEIGRHVRHQLVGYIALFVALGGVSYAAVNLPAKSVGAKQLKNGAVTPPKVAASTIALFKGQSGLPGAQGNPGAPGANGTNGTNGGRGPSDVYQIKGGSMATSGDLTLPVPAGDYLVVAKATLGGAAGNGYCALEGGTSSGTPASDQGFASISPTIVQATLTAIETTHFDAPGAITLHCVTGAPTFDNRVITATQVGAVH